MKNSLLFSLCLVLLLNHALAARLPRQLRQQEAFPVQQEALQPENLPPWLSDWLKQLIDWFTNPSNKPFPIPIPTFPLPPPSQGTPPGPYDQEALGFSPPWLSNWLKQLIDWLANPTNKPFPIPMFPLPPPSQGSPPVPVPDQEALALAFSPENLPSWLSDWLKQLIDWFANPINKPFPIPNFPLFPQPPPSQGTPPGPANLEGEAFAAVNPDFLINLPPWLKNWLKELRHWCADPSKPFPTPPWLRHPIIWYAQPPSQGISPAPAMAPAASPNSPAPAMAPA